MLNLRKAHIVSDRNVALFLAIGIPSAFARPWLMFNHNKVHSVTERPTALFFRESFQLLEGKYERLNKTPSLKTSTNWRVDFEENELKCSQKQWDQRRYIDRKFLESRCWLMELKSLPSIFSLKSDNLVIWIWKKVKVNCTLIIILSNVRCVEMGVLHFLMLGPEIFRQIQPWWIWHVPCACQDFLLCVGFLQSTEIH